MIGWMDRWSEGKIDKLTDGWMSGWINRQMDK